MFAAPRAWEAAVVERGDGRRLARTFGIDGSLNRNAWRVTPESIMKCARTFMGKPGVWYESCNIGKCVQDHPPGDPTRPCAHTLELQEPYRVSTIVDVEVTNSARAYLVHEVHDNALWERISRSEPLFVSPSLCPSRDGVRLGGTDEWGRQVSTLTDWTALHTAFVDVPAYGPKATVISHCEGAECGRDGTIPEFAQIHATQALKGPTQVPPGETSQLFDDSKSDIMAASHTLAARALGRK